jgi:IclR family transcriptional regulator, mhp operon transcriptional activator
VTSYQPVAAALRVLEVLAAVNRLRERATVGEIHRQTGFDKATIVRMLETLMQAGYVLRSPSDDRRYRVTGRTLMLCSGFDSHKLIGTIAGPILSELQQSIDWPSDVAIFDGDSMLVIESSREGGALSFNRAPGYRGPVLGTSLGLAYLAHTNADELEAFIKVIEEDCAPWNDLVRDRTALKQTLARIRRQGYATMAPSYSRQEYADRVFSLGVPIMSADKVYAAINVVYLRNALSMSAARDRLLKPLQQAADRMAAEIKRRMPATPHT